MLPIVMSQIEVGKYKKFHVMLVYVPQIPH